MEATDSTTRYGLHSCSGVLIMMRIPERLDGKQALPWVASQQLAERQTPRGRQEAEARLLGPQVP